MAARGEAPLESVKACLADLEGQFDALRLTLTEMFRMSKINNVRGEF